MIHVVFTDADNLTCNSLRVFNRLRDDLVTPSIHLVVSILVTDDEMHHIKELFGTYNGPGLGWHMSIPWNFKAQSQTWYGDIAKTILANL